MDKTKIKWIALAIAVVLAFTGVGIAIGLAIQINNPNAALSFATPGLLDYEIFNDEGHITLSLAAAGDQSSYTRTITATVLPEDAPVKTVRWWVTWSAESDISFDDVVVSHYVTVTPNSDGSTSATIQCLKPFEGADVVITCKTDVGGYIATCTVRYIGTPNSLAINTSGYSAKSFDGWGVSGIEIGCGSTATIPLQLDNYMHAVGSSFGNYSVQVVAHGGIINHTYAKNNYTGAETESNVDLPITVQANAEGNGYFAYMQIPQTLFFKVFEAKIVDGNLVLTAENSFSAYYFSGGERSGPYTYSFNGYIDGKKPYFEVIVTETGSGVSQSINVTTQASVTSLSLSTTNIEF